MVRKYQFADIASLITLLIDLSSLIILNGPKFYVVIGCIVVIAAAILIRRYYPVNIDSMIKRFDFNVAWVVLCYIYAALNQIYDTRWIIPSAVACIILLVLILFMRTSASVVKGKIAAVIIFVIVLGLAAVISTSVGEAAGGAVVGLFEAIGLGFKWIGQMIDRFIQYLISLLPDVEANGGKIVTGEAIHYDIPEEIEEASSPILGYIAAIIVAAVVIYALVKLFKYLIRKGPAVKSTREKLVVTKKERTKFAIAFDKLRKELAYQIKMRIYMTKDTALSKYYRLVYSKRLSPEHKQKSETPREFITRVSDFDSNFIDEVEKMLYQS